MQPVDVATNLLEAFNARCTTSLPTCYVWTTVESRNGGWPTPSQPKVISSGLDEGPIFAA